MNNHEHTAECGEVLNASACRHEVHFGTIRVITTYAHGGSVVHEFPKEYRLNLQQRKQILQILHGAEPMKSPKVKRLERGATRDELARLKQAEDEKRQQDKALRKRLFAERNTNL